MYKELNILNIFRKQVPDDSFYKIISCNWKKINIRRFPKEFSPIMYMVSASNTKFFSNLPERSVITFQIFDNPNTKLDIWQFMQSESDFVFKYEDDLSNLSVEDWSYRNTILDEIPDALIESDCSFLFWDPWEAMDYFGIFIILTIIHNFCIDKGINPNRFILSDSSMSSMIASKYYSIYEYENQVDFIPLNPFEHRPAEYYRNKTPVINNEVRGKHFICLNRIPKNHRQDILAFLLKAGLMPKTHASISDYVHLDYFSWDRDEPKLGLDPIDYTALADISPIVLDEENMVNNDGPIFGPYKPGNIEPFINDSYIQIVTETLVEGDLVFITEKTFKCFHYKQPFIIIGNPGSLLELRRAGYKTFPRWIDESYDLIQNYDDRMLAIFSEIKRLSCRSIEDLHQMRAEMKEILDYNAERARWINVVRRSYETYNKLIGV